MTTREKRKLVEKVAALAFSKKEKDWFWKLITKPMKDWSDDEIVILTVLYDAHYIPLFSCGGIDICNAENAKNIWRLKFNAAREKVNNIFYPRSSSTILPLSPTTEEQLKVKPEPFVFPPLPPSPVIREQTKVKPEPLVLPPLPPSPEIKVPKQILKAILIPHSETVIQ